MGGPGRWSAPTGAGTCFLAGCRPEAYGPLLDAALDGTPDADQRDVYVEVDQTDAAALAALAEHGSRPHRREHNYAVSTDPGHTGLAGRVRPDGFEIVSAADADLERPST